LNEESKNISTRLPNRKRERDHFETNICSYSDKEFQSASGLSRIVFNYLLFKLKEKDILKDTPKNDHAINSSGSPITLACKLFIHQRLCRGADINEFLIYSLDVKHIWSQIWYPIAFHLDKILNNINFKPECKEWCDNQARLVILDSSVIIIIIIIIIFIILLFIL